jgi:arylsulfatase A-like enzyme
VFWIMDTLRADRVRPWQADARAQVPNFEKLAGTSTVFKNAYVQGNASTTSHASMWTSLYPINHRVISAGEGWTWKIADELPTLGEMVKKAGFFLSGVTANGFVTADAGYGEGFDRYTNLMREMNPDRVNGAVPGEKLLARALASVKGKVGQSFLLFIGTIDTHAPWIAHEPWTSLYDPGPYKGKFKRSASGGGIGVKKGRMISTDPPEPRDLQRLNALYDADVSYQDALVGKLLATLESWGILDETMIIITADHGEELFEDGRGGHGGSLRETLVHVPLLIHYPPLFPAVAVEEGVDNLDLLPTILDALGKSPPDELQGESLLPLAHGVGRGYPRPSIASHYEWAHAMRLAGWKMRVDKTGIPQLYNVAVDPFEKKILTDERPLERRFLTDAFALFLHHQKHWKKTRWGVPSNMTPRAAQELEAR